MTFLTKKLKLWIAFVLLVCAAFEVSTNVFLNEKILKNEVPLKTISEPKDALTIDKKLEIQLRNITTIITDALLKEFTYTKTGGPADIIAFPKSKAEVQSLIKYCEVHGIPWTVVGKGSNLVVKEGGIRGIVIILTDMRNLSVKGQQIIAEAGVRLKEASDTALQHSLSGLEFTCGIPGSIGGAVYMNAGSYGGEIKDALKSAEVLFSDGSIKTLTNKDMQFSYRYSALQDMHCVILEATFSLKEGNKELIRDKMDELTEFRESKQPMEYPSCGSVFKRPEGYYAGKLIKDAGLQGLKCGGAQISKKHAGFIVNVDHATATDYMDIIGHIQNTVYEKFKVKLKTEVRFVGES